MRGWRLDARHVRAGTAVIMLPAVAHENNLLRERIRHLEEDLARQKELHGEALDREAALKVKLAAIDQGEP